MVKHHDHVFMEVHNLPLVRKISIPSSPWSDQDPLVSLLSLSGLTKRPFHRWINESLLTTQATCQHIQSSIQTYFADNVGSVTSAVFLWEAHKATVCGHIIQLASSRKWDRECRITELHSLLAAADVLLEGTPHRST